MVKKIALGMSLSALMMLGTQAWGAVTETETEITDAIDKIAPIYQKSGTDGMEVYAVSTPSAAQALHLGSFGASFASTTSAESMWYLDSSNYLWAMSMVGNAWRSFKSTLIPASWNATTTVTLTEVNRDGTANPGSAYTLALLLTKTGAVADLTSTNLYTFLSKSATKALLVAGTTLTATGATLTTGWSAKATMSDGTPAAVAANLEPINATLTVTITPLGGSAVTYSSYLTNLTTWNVATNATTKFDVPFTSGSNNYSVTLQGVPANYVRTAGVLTGLLAAANSLPKRIYQSSTTVGSLNSLSTAATSVLAKFDSTPPANLNTAINDLAVQAVSGALFAIGDFTTKFDTNKNGLVAVTSANITSVTWSIQNRYLVANGKIGTGAKKDFKCNLTGVNVIKAGSNDVQQFKSDDGDLFILKMVDATGYDESANNTYGAGNQDLLIIMTLHSLLNGIGTIAASQAIPLVTASQS